MDRLYLLLLSQVLIGLAIIYLLLGPKLLKHRAKSVRLKDEKLHNAKGAKSSSSDQIIIFAGSIGGAGIAYAITGNLFFTLIGLSGGYFSLKWLHKKREDNRRELLRKQFPDILSQLEAATGGNLNTYQALEDAVPNLPRPARDVFFEVLRRVRTGETLADAMDTVIAETNWKDLKILSLGFRLNSRMGINVSKICSHALESYYEQEGQRGQIRGTIAQNMMTLRVLSGLPFFVVGLARVVSPEFAAPLFQTLEGGIFFAVCVGMIVIGNVVAKKMITTTLEG